MSTVMVTGDINIVNVEDPARPLRHVTGLLGSADAVFSNLECTLHDPPPSHSVYHEGFYANPAIGIDVLRRARVSAVGIANNVNYGRDAILASIGALDAAGIPHSGAGASVAEARKAVIVERGGARYGFLQRSSIYWATDHAADATAPGIAVIPGHTAYEVPMYRYDPSIPPVNRPGIPPKIVTWADRRYLDEYCADIEKLRSEVDFLIASNHWGLRADVLDYMTQIAHAAIEHGADMVMGHGPHQPLPISFYRDRPIFYGLGSFCFHTGHLGIAHGDWIGLLGRIEHRTDGRRVSFRFVRHNDENETLLRSPEEEQGALASLAKRSEPFGAALSADGDYVLATPA
jgi:poly-gamma-glutamate capsule biosynthesis protein CapA/YwtB (metallophosphatase superfamily)